MCLSKVTWAGEPRYHNQSILRGNDPLKIWKGWKVFHGYNTGQYSSLYQPGDGRYETGKWYLAACFFNSRRYVHSEASYALGFHAYEREKDANEKLEELHRGLTIDFRRTITMLPVKLIGVKAIGYDNYDGKPCIVADWMMIDV